MMNSHDPHIESRDSLSGVAVVFGLASVIIAGTLAFLLIPSSTHPDKLELSELSPSEPFIVEGARQSPPIVSWEGPVTRLSTLVATTDADDLVDRRFTLTDMRVTDVVSDRAMFVTSAEVPLPRDYFVYLSEPLHGTIDEGDRVTLSGSIEETERVTERLGIEELDTMRQDLYLYAEAVAVQDS